MKPSTDNSKEDLNAARRFIEPPTMNGKCYGWVIIPHIGMIKISDEETLQMAEMFFDSIKKKVNGTNNSSGENNQSSPPSSQRNMKKKVKPFSEDEIEFIIENYGKLKVKDIANHLRRNPSTIYNKIWYLKKSGKIKKTTLSGAKPKFIKNTHCIHDCKNCQYGKKENFGDYYWCEKFKRRVLPDGTIIESEVVP